MSDENDAPAPSSDPTPDPAPSSDPTPTPAPSSDPTPARRSRGGGGSVFGAVLLVAVAILAVYAAAQLWGARDGDA